MIDNIPHALREVWRLHHAAQLSTDELQALQWKRFGRILRHAFEHSRFYRERLNRAGLGPEDIRTREDLQHIPITTRDDLSDSQPLIADTADLANLRSSSSSGTTGQKTVTYFDARAWLKGKYLLKARARYLCGVRPWDRVAKFQQGIPGTDWFRRVLLRQQGYPLGPACDETWKRVKPYAPTVLYGFPSYLIELARASPEPIRARLIFTSGEMLGDDQREVLEQASGGRVLDIYGCTEVKEISWQCSLQAGYHINSDWLLVETVTQEGAPTAREGRILVTSLYNAAMPLIRYELGDLGALETRPCDCGLSLPTMRPGLGRRHDLVVLADGTTVSPLRVIDALRRIEAVDQYQVVQGPDGAITVKVVARREYRGKIPHEIVTALRPVVPSRPVKVEFQQRIDREPNGKYRRVISERSPDRAQWRG